MALPAPSLWISELNVGGVVVVVRRAVAATIALALTAAGHLSSNLARVVVDGTNVEARTGMLYGSLLAGIAFGN